MPFMEPEITEKQWWLTVDDREGGQVISMAPGELYTRTEIEEIRQAVDNNDLEQLFRLISDYVTARSHRDLSNPYMLWGYGARLSASGYMDATEWYVASDPEEIADYLINELSDYEEAEEPEEGESWYEEQVALIKAWAKREKAKAPDSADELDPDDPMRPI